MSSCPRYDQRTWDGNGFLVSKRYLLVRISQKPGTLGGESCSVVGRCSDSVIPDDVGELWALEKWALALGFLNSTVTTARIMFVMWRKSVYLSGPSLQVGI